MELLLNIFILSFLISNLFWCRKETITSLCCYDKKASLSISKSLSKLLKFNFGEKSVSKIGVLFFFIAYIPTFLLSAAVILLTIISMVNSIFSLNLPSVNSIIILMVAFGIAIYYVLICLIFRIMTKASELSKSDIDLLKNKIAQLPKYVWFFMLACFPIPIVVGKAITILVCLLGAALCVAFGINLQHRAKTSSIVYTLVIVVAVTWGLSYLAVEILYSH